jgi:transglutaminase-like putative cysteine protease
MSERVPLRKKNILDWYKLTAVILFLIVVLLLVNIVTRLDRGLQAESLRILVLLAGAFGLLLSVLKKPNPILIVLISFLGGAAAAFVVIGDLIRPIVELLQTSLMYIPSYWQYGFARMELFRAAIQLRDKWGVFEQTGMVLYDRLRTWLVALPDPAYDPVSLNLVWGIAVWLVSIWIYWFVFNNKQVLAGFLPPLLVIAGIYRMVDDGILTLLVVLGIGLLLAMLANQAQDEDFWRRQNFSFSGVIRERVVQYGLLVSVVIVVFAAAVSSPRIDEFIEEMKERRRQAENAAQEGDGVREVASQDEESLIGPAEVLEETANGWLPNVHLIGSPPELAEIEVFHAKVEEPNIDNRQSYYFRSATYETFTLNGWQNFGKEFILIPPEEEFEIDFTPNERLIFQEVTLLRDFSRGNLMVVVGELVAADVAHYGSYHTKFVNNTYADLFASVTRATQYAAYSKIPYFGENELRNTSLEYPDWIANKYLQVPNSVPDRVYDLALSLTATQPTPYDRALAIEQFLRQFEYTLDIEDPPEHRDIVDYFLFDLQKGYCDYYASSMVVLARAAGIPARLATGYLASTFDLENEQFAVTADQAHSWAEIYFPEFGWVTFEPTAGRPALERQEEREMMPDELASEFENEVDLQSSDGRNFQFIPDNLFVLAGQVTILFFLGLVAVHGIDRWTLLAMASDRMFARVYRRLRKSAERLGVRIKDTDTPLEFSDLLTAYLSRNTTNKLFSRLLDSTPENAALIISACNQAAYAASYPGKDAVRRVISAWGQLRWQLILARVLVRLQPIGTELRRIWTRLQQPA